LCGFANFASVGMQIGCMSALAPGRSKVFTKYATKAMIAGNLTNFISGKYTYIKVLIFWILTTDVFLSINLSLHSW